MAYNIDRVCLCLECIFIEAKYAEVAQLVEHVPEEDGVGGSSPPLGTI